MSKSVFVVSELYYPEETSTGYFLTKIAEGLARYFPLSVLCAQPTYLKRGARATSRETRNGVMIYRCLSTTLDKNRLLFKTINLLTITFSMLINAMVQFGSNDRILVVTNPPTLPFAVALACLFRHSKYLLLIHDVYPEVLEVTGMFGRKSLLFRLVSWLHEILYRKAERVITLGRDMQMLAMQKVVDPEKVVVIPNWGDVDEIVPRQLACNRLLRELKLEEKFVIEYMGNIGRTHDVEVLLECAQRLADHLEFHFLFVGWGAKKAWLEFSIKEHSLDNVTLLPSQKREDLAETLNACNIAIISFVPGMVGISVPSRMYNIMAVGKPIIAVADGGSELAMVVQEEQIGWVVPPCQPDRIAKVILEAKDNPKLLAAMGRRARAAVENKYSYENVIQNYYALINGLDDVPKKKK